MLRLHQVRKAYGPTVAVDGVSFTIEAGELFGLLGPNGAGKTTIVNLAIGLLEPDAGTIELAGLGSPTSPRVRRRIGVAPQSLAVYDELTGEENVTFFGRLYGLAGRQLAERVRHTLCLVGLWERRRGRVKTYSGGMKRRLNLAVALVHQPGLLLLDEPTVGVDPQSRNAIFDQIRTLRDEGCTIVYTTHYMEEAQRLCDRVGIMDHGRMLAIDTVDALIDSHGGKTLVRADSTEGTTTIETDDPLGELARIQNGSRLLRFSVDRPDLERVFLNLTGRHLRD